MNFLAIDLANLPLPAIAVAAFGIAFVIYVYIAKAINDKKAPEQVTQTVAAQTPAAPVAAPAVYTGPELIGVEEREAAVIMAVVSHKTGIPLNRLKFESIKLMEDK
ncbi:MAG: hypothetical protein IJ491_02450 [Clostridia bacterium]|nr:hypothetical protein [Clostridia bacterium]